MKSKSLSAVLAGFLSAALVLAQWSDFNTQTTSSKLATAINSKPAARAGAGAPTGDCASGKDFYVRTTPQALYACGPSGWFIVNEGSVGATGAAGIDGTNGTNGINGASGAAGATGPSGPLGGAVVAKGFIAADTYTVSSQANTAFGTQGNLLVSSGTTSWVKFDLSAYGSLSGVVVSKAYIAGYVRLMNTTGTINVCPAASSWSETTTHNTAPSTDCTAGYTLVTTAANSWILSDVTALVQSWLTTPSGNYGVALVPTGSVNVQMDSKETTSTSHEFELVVVLQAVATAPIPITAVSGLPTCNAGAEGTSRGVNDALLPVALATVGAGGSVHVPVYCNGTNWIVP